MGSSPAKVGVRGGGAIHCWLGVDGQKSGLVHLDQLLLDGLCLQLQGLHLIPRQHVYLP